MADHQTPAASTKKKHSKKRKAVNVTVDASLTGAGASSVAPVVAYFPTGYDPMAAASGAEPPLEAPYLPRARGIDTLFIGKFEAQRAEYWETLYSSVDKRCKLLNEQRNDPSAFLDLDLGNSETNVDAGNIQATVVRNIPPYDPAADTSEKAYLFDEIIPKSICPHLMDIVGYLESGGFSSKGYGSFVSNRVQKLQELQGEGKERLAWILSYITHLLSLLARNSSMSKRHRKENQASHGPVIPQAVYQKLLLMFTEPGSSALSTEKHELMITTFWYSRFILMTSDLTLQICVPT
ncbi:hypothetical protein ABZP36_009164 [Zizania latifolia]